MATFFHYGCFVLQLLLVNFILLRFAAPLLNALALGTSGQLFPYDNQSNISGNPNYAHWLKTLGGYIGKDAVMQSIVAGSMVDGNGDLYSVIFKEVNSNGALYYVVKRSGDVPSTIQTTAWYPWNCLSPAENVPETPYFNFYDNDYYFKSRFFHALQPCIAQEVGTGSDVYVIVYVPIIRLYTGSLGSNTEGYVATKFKKSSLSEEAPEYFQSYTCQSCISNNGLEIGNIQAWHDSDKLHLNYIYLGTANNTETARWIHRYNGNDKICFAGKNALGIGLQPRAIKYGNYIYDMGGYSGTPYIAKRESSSYATKSSINGYAEPFSLYASANVRRCWDFCIVDNPSEPDKPMFCVLGLQPPYNSSSANTVISSSNVTLWTYISWGKTVVLLLASSEWDTTTSCSCSNLDFGPEDPQNTIYATGVTPSSISSISTGYSSDQLYFNTHKLCTYTSPLGKNYIIYCYCYPRKEERELYLGYAQYAVRKNSNGKPKVCLLTKCERCVSTTCNRIFHMDCKNDHLWITWIGGSSSSSKDDSTYYYYHVKASELIEE